MKNKRIQIIWRYGLVSVVVSILAVLIVTSTVRTTIIHADKWNHKADSLLSRVFLVQPKRGEILACDGSVLATNLTAYTICLDYRSNAPQQEKFIAALDSLSDSLARYYPIRNKDEWREHLAKPLKAKPSERVQYYVLLKDANYGDYLRIMQFPFFNKYKKNRYKHGLYYNTREVRVMPYGSMARRSIGRCNKVRVPKFVGENSTRDSMDALHGYSGLESALDQQLYGKAGTAKYVQLTHGVRSWIDQPAIDGNTVKTTIDINMQDIVENELQAMLQKTRAEWGTCILMEVATGEIKAISNLDRDENGNYIEAMNYALRAYEPGSVMKPISMVVALEDGFAQLDKYYQIGRSYAYAGGSPIHDTHSPAELPVSRFIEYSSNIGMTKLIAPHYENDLNGFRERLREIGLFDTLNTGMAGERPPYFPTLDPKAGGRISLSRMAYGYSTMIPPLYTCAMYNAIANDGKFVRPRMVKELIHPSGEIERIPVSYVRDSICSAKNARILREMIYGVVYGDGGTAKSLRNDIVTVVGKTGTCRIAYEANRNDTANASKDRQVIKGYKEGQYRLAFCGFYPYENPKYTCMVLISNPSPEYNGAATTSGTVVKNIALKMYARGMLDNQSTIKEVKGADPNPILYAITPTTESSIEKITGATPKHFQRPPQPQPGKTPNVKGLTMREAIARIESAGYNVKIVGSGYAFDQYPRGGTPLRDGATVTVSFIP